MQCGYLWEVRPLKINYAFKKLQHNLVFWRIRLIKALYLHDGWRGIEVAESTTPQLLTNPS